MTLDHFGAHETKSLWTVDIINGYLQSVHKRSSIASTINFVTKTFPIFGLKFQDNVIQYILKYSASYMTNFKTKNKFNIALIVIQILQEYLFIHIR